MMKIIVQGAFLLLTGSAAVGGLTSFARMQIRGRRLKDLPTSQIRSAAQGNVELQGRAKARYGAPLKSPLTGAECVWYHVRVEYEQNDTTRIVLDETSVAPILVDDGTGECLIFPDQAEIRVRYNKWWRGSTKMPKEGPPKLSRDISWGSYRYREQLIRVNERITAQGWFVTGYPQAGKALDDLTRRTIHEWKRYPHMLERFDTNNDGHMDEKEFAILRQEARRHAESRLEGPASQSGENTLTHTADMPLFITSIPQRLDSENLIHQSWLVIGGVVIFIGALFFLIDGIGYGFKLF